MRNNYQGNSNLQPQTRTLEFDGDDFSESWFLYLREWDSKYGEKMIRTMDVRRHGRAGVDMWQRKRGGRKKNTYLTSDFNFWAW